MRKTEKESARDFSFVCVIVVFWSWEQFKSNDLCILNWARCNQIERLFNTSSKNRFIAPFNLLTNGLKEKREIEISIRRRIEIDWEWYRHALELNRICSLGMNWKKLNNFSRRNERWTDGEKEKKTTKLLQLKCNLNSWNSVDAFLCALFALNV